NLNFTGNGAGGTFNASGFSGNVTATGGDGDDFIATGNGNDVISGSHGGGRNVFDGGEGDNQLTLTSAIGGTVVDLDTGISLDADFLDSWWPKWADKDDRKELIE